MPKKDRLLLNFVYCRPVGHVVEGMRYAHGFHKANKNLEISIALNSKSATELTKEVGWIKNTYLVDTDEILKYGINAPCLRKIPKEWDYVVTENRADLESLGEKKLWNDQISLIAYSKYARNIFHAKKGHGVLFWKRRLPRTSLKYKAGTQFFLDIPKDALKFAEKYAYKGKKICVMLGGSADPSHYPSIKSWERIIRALNKEFPDLRIYLTGVFKSSKGRTNTQAYSKKQVGGLAKKFDNVVNAYDIGLWNQLALVKSCDIFLSPHTGFGWIVPCVGTPWLALSGGDWYENSSIFNKLPFYCVLPDDKDYPYEGKKRIGKRAKMGGMKEEDIRKKIPEILKGARLLFSKDFTYEKAFQTYIQNLKGANVKKEFKKRMTGGGFKPSW